jgi:hypothetical protein
MNLDEIIKELDLEVLTDPKDFSQDAVSGGYASDLLSCVMSTAKKGNLWLTLQAHINIVAVAALLELSAVIITENAQPDAATILTRHLHPCRKAVVAWNRRWLSWFQSENEHALDAS